MRSVNVRIFVATLCATFIHASCLFAADPPSVEITLKFKPVQRGVQIEVPKGEDLKNCRVEAEKGRGLSGWVLYGPGGQVLRKFLDTNADNVVDQWRYYNLGLETYRDIDSNRNNKVDQSRWVNGGGSRWGIDTDEDGRIDRWRVMSAEEAAEVAVNSLLQSDAAGLESVLLNPDDARTLRLSGSVRDKLLAATSNPGQKADEIMSKSKVLSKSTKFVRFDGQSPGIIPADAGKSDEDLFVYPNAMAIVETNGKSAILQLGELVRVGDVWKLTNIPRAIEGERVVLPGGVLLQPPSSIPGRTGNMSEETLAVLEKLQKLDAAAPGPGSSRQAISRYNQQRAAMMNQLISKATNPQEREQWIRQLSDGLAAAVQGGTYDDGLQQLKSLEQQTKQNNASTELQAYVSYRRLLADYAMRLQTNNSEKRNQATEWWSEQLESFWKNYPESPDSATALFQLAMSHEFVDELKEAKRWYQQCGKQYGDTNQGQKALGALRRLELQGKPLELSGKTAAGQPISLAQYRGKVVLVPYWATWCIPCKEDLPMLRGLYEEYNRRGFEIVGINLDTDAAAVGPFVKQNRIPWKSFHEPKGQDGPLSRDFGIVSVPTMFLVGKDGRVLSRSVSIDMLKKELPRLLK